VADKTERRAAEVGSASEEAWSNPSSVERFLSAIDETVAERLDQQAVRARLAQLQRAAERMPKTTDPDWARLVEELARYGHQVVRSWVLVLQSLEEHASESLYPARPPLTSHEADLLASETVARAINSFDGEVMRTRWWVQDRSIDPQTMFLVECAMHFPDAHRSRLLEVGELSSDAQEWWWLPTDEADYISDVLRSLEYLVRNEKGRIADVLRPTGYTEAEAAEIIGATQRVFDRRMRLGDAEGASQPPHEADGGGGNT
jgi:hypothetical protein